MILEKQFREDVCERIANIPSETFAFLGLSKETLMKDSDIINGVWARYQKNIEEYCLEPDEAFCDALESETSVCMAKLTEMPAGTAGQCSIRLHMAIDTAIREGESAKQAKERILSSLKPALDAAGITVKASSFTLLIGDALTIEA